MKTHLRGLAAVLLLLLLPLTAAAGVLTVDVLDIGQGDAILVRGGGKTALIDSGDRNSPTVAQLHQLGVERLDLVVASHPHADHIGRMPDVLQSFEVGLYLDSGLPHTTRIFESTMSAVEDVGVDYASANRGMILRLGEEATFTVLFPIDGKMLRGTRSDLNSNSVVLRLDHGANSFLFTGDAEAPTERALIAAGIEPVDVLKVPHHGSHHSSTRAFLEALGPQIAVISAGRANKYGHPDDEAVHRLGEVGAAIYRTDLSSHLRIISDGESLEVLEGSVAEIAQMKIAQMKIAQVETTTPPSQPAAEVALSKRELRKQVREARRAARAARRAER